MLIIFGFLIIITSVILGLIVLIQNPKGGGLSGTFGGFSNQLMGVKQTTDVLEKGTWIFAGILGLLCLFSAAFIPKSAGSSSKNDEMYKNLNVNPQSTKPAPVNTTTPMPTSPAPQKTP